MVQGRKTNDVKSLEWCCQSLLSLGGIGAKYEVHKIICKSAQSSEKRKVPKTLFLM